MSGTYLFAGSWQVPCYGLTSHGDGIHVYRADPESGSLTPVYHYRTEVNTSILAISPNRRNLYATDEQRDHGGVQGAGGGVLAFAISPDGGLRLLSNVRTYSPCTSYVTVDASNRLLAFSNHGSTAAGQYQVSFRRRADGHYETYTVTDRVSVGVYALDDGGAIVGDPDIHPLDVNGAHFHSVMFSPSGRWLLACDKGTDKICVFRVDLAQRRVIENDVPYFQAAERIAPRHIVFLPGTPYFFVCNELGFTVSAYRLDENTGVICAVDNQPTLPVQIDAALGGVADIRIQGDFLYVSNRFREPGVSPSYIAVSKIDRESGKLTPVEYCALTGENPRGFNFDPTGRFLYTGDMNSDTITRYLVDGETGRLSAPRIVAEMGSPSCIQLASL